MALKTISSCRACGGSKIEPFLDLGEQPFANALLKSPQDAITEKKYPLRLAFCLDCSLVQLMDTADPKELFSNYFWVTGTSSTAKEHAKRFCENVLTFGSQTEPNYILEVASNDGTFLREFIGREEKVLGVDPAANIVDEANRQGIPTECAFFGEAVARSILERHGAPHIAFARNVLPHVADVHDFLKGFQILLGEKGLLVLEVHSAKVILEELHYDSVYHEHLCYFSLKSLKTLLKQFGFQIAKVAESPISGGSIVVFAQKNPKTIDSSVEDYEKLEKQSRINEFYSWQQFEQGVLKHKGDLWKLLNEELQEGREVVGYGASARSSTLLNFCGIDSRHLKKIADQNRRKWGHSTPGTLIPIVDPKEVLNKSCTILVLAWNFFDEIRAYLKKGHFPVKLIRPLPNEPRRFDKI